MEKMCRFAFLLSLDEKLKVERTSIILSKSYFIEHNVKFVKTDAVHVCGAEKEIHLLIQ